MNALEQRAAQGDGMLAWSRGEPRPMWRGVLASDRADGIELEARLIARRASRCTNWRAARVYSNTLGQSIELAEAVPFRAHFALAVVVVGSVSVAAVGNSGPY